MEPRIITDRYHVSPQISPEDAAAIKQAGYTLVIDNRPDGEVPPDFQADAMRVAMEAAGLRFEVLPLTHQTMHADNIMRQSEMIESAEGKVLAYCASGTRSTVVWALGKASDLGADAVLETAAQAGYNLEGLRPTLRALAER
ncbi:TIGR01244 family sulfur transferase [Ponticoccus alexandrii]|uniref:TIGR01244 family phosphatase n=1 Tax=Ponticoccus alexandrii TaxID=1943633 RepID=A0ABX7FD42_9RHOB|nr:TIGR01244 family sulfur transferase [Ponticoccus alexandrii]QRF67287.1 TIGR01244 family phosphatase [Ponticoccus alexandrii]